MEKSGLLKNLKSNGFAIDEGLHYCGNSETIYSEVLLSACEEGKEKIPLLAKCIELKDIKRYQIEVHGIKNVAMTIGATQLCKSAASQNDLAKAGDWEGICNNQEKLLQIYEQTIKSIQQSLSTSD